MFKSKILAFLLALALSAPCAAVAQSVSTSGTIAGNSCTILPLSPGQSNASIQLGGTFTSGQINFLVSNDGVSYFVSPTDSITSATAVGLSFVTVASAKFLEACGASVVGSVTASLVATPAVAPKGGGGASSAVNITAVGGNAVTTTVPVSGTVTTTPSGTQSVQGTGTAGAAAGGVLTVQGVAGGTTTPVSCTGGTCNVTVLQPTAASLNATVVQTAGNFFGTQEFYPANTAGGGCSGITAAGAQIVKKSFIANASVAGPTTEVAGVASTIIHVCSLSYGGSSATTAGNYQITSCTGAVLVFSLSVGTLQTIDTLGDGADGLFDIATGSGLCLTQVAVGAVGQVFGTYAQY